MSNADDQDKKPPPQPTVAWDPSEVAGLDPQPAASTPPGGAQAGPGTAPAGQSPSGPPPASAPPADPNATMAFTAEDIARLEEESAAVEAAAAEEDRLIGTLIRDKWKVEKRLGAGSFGTVYKVKDVKGGWVEALKILGVDRMTGAEAEEMRARFLREAQIMKRLGKDSKHIVGLSTYEEDIESGLVYFLMEFVEGKSLADALSDEGPFPVDRTIRIALQVCDALMAAHEGPEPVVHRDLKLENLMLTKDRVGNEIIKVLDFGIAKIAEREADSRLTTVGTLGTPGYAAPEQLRAEAVDGRTDLFAFGVILYALLTGRDPWLGNLAHEPTHQIYELMVATDRAHVRPMTEQGVAISPEMINVVMKLLRRDPAQRFQSARELRETLLRMERGEAVPESAGPAVAAAPAAAPVAAPSKPKPAPRRAPAPAKKKGGGGKWVAAAVLVLAGAGTAWARPWGRTLDPDGLVSLVNRGEVSQVWVTQAGMEGGISLVPIAALADLRTPVSVSLDEEDITPLVRRLEAAGATVDVSWEVRRLTDLAAQAQSHNRYFGAEGSDVVTYAQRLADLVPDSPEAASLMLKVGEHMAWDAEEAIRDGPPDAARALVDECLRLVPNHPRCLQVSGEL